MGQNVQCFSDIGDKSVDIIWTAFQVVFFRKHSCRASTSYFFPIFSYFSKIFLFIPIFAPKFLFFPIFFTHLE